jgi:predicted alpha/beta hydrolase
LVNVVLQEKYTFYINRSFNKMKTFQVQKPNGKSITATVFAPSVPLHRTLLISVATGMKQSFYYKFAAYYAEQGYYVYTYDYTDIGLSKSGSLRGSETSYTTWGAEDYPAMVSFVKKQHPEEPIYLIGHSFGGNCLGMTEVSNDLAAIVTVASQQGYWRNFNDWQRYFIWFVFAVTMPLLTRLLGYFPSKTHGLGEDLPKNVSGDWSNVILKPEGVTGLSDKHSSWFEKITRPMLMISLDDDTYAPKQTVDNLAQCYSRAEIERKNIVPKECNADSIGHLNFFRAQFQETLWQIPLQYFEKQHHGQKEKRTLAYQ